MKKATSFHGFTLASACALGLIGCSHSEPAVPRQLNPTLSWHGDNRGRLDALIQEHRVDGEALATARRPVAVFDWDNTVMKNDVGDATFFWMVRNDKVLQPPNGNWRLTSASLTADAAASLAQACGTLAEPGQPLPTSTSAACATELVTVYSSAKTTSGKAAFSGWNYRRMEPSYAWAAQLTAGHTVAESRAFAESALQENLAAAQGATQKVGSVDGLTAWVRIYEQQKDLIGTLQDNGWDVWIVSASPQPWVEAAATRVSIAADHVVGIRLVESAGRLTYDLQGCGDVPDGQNDGAGGVRGNSLITYIDGKRCWVNKAIYGDTSAGAMQRNANAAMRPLLSAGDSDTDVTFLQDAVGLKLVLNRNKKELMCNAYGNTGGRWLVNPMFIEPKAQQAAPYPCATSACKSADGASVACVDEDGKPIADQQDTVFGP